jgi:hypothetical protein
MTLNRLLVLLVRGNILSFGGATILAVVGGFDFRGVIPAIVFLLYLDILAVRCVVQNKKKPTDLLAAPGKR